VLRELANLSTPFELSGPLTLMPQRIEIQ
jgi:hypothetical protein